MLYAFMILLLVSAGLLYKISTIYRAADEISMQLAEHMEMDTNTGIDISCSDRKMKALAAGLDRQLKLLRKKQLLYTRGDQELKTAVTNISHDIRTPLTAVCGYLSLLKEEEMSDHAVQYVKIIENRTQVMKDLAEELFRYSVILMADSDKQIEEVSLNALLEESIAGYYGAVIKAGIQPEIFITECEVKRMLNRQAVARIFSNIISNALKYSDGDLKIRLEPDGTVSFSNHAANLDQVGTGYLFERFYTVESGRSSTGLGLAIARTLTEEMKGKIWAEYRDRQLHIYVRFDPGLNGNQRNQRQAVY